MMRLASKITIGAALVSGASAATPPDYSLQYVIQSRNCGEYFANGGYCVLGKTLKRLDSYDTCTGTAGTDGKKACGRPDCCYGEERYVKGPALDGTEDGDCKTTYFATVPTFTITETTPSRTSNIPATTTVGSCPTDYYVNNVNGKCTGKCTFEATKVPAPSPAKEFKCCTTKDCCTQIPTVKTCNDWRKSNGLCSQSMQPQGADKICPTSGCTEDSCCFHEARVCSTGFFNEQKICPDFYSNRKSDTPCSQYMCSTLDCCKLKPGVTQCSTWWKDNLNTCGRANAKLEFRKDGDPFCAQTPCKEADCCAASPTCDGYAGCSLPEVVTHITKSCKGKECTNAECCVKPTQCASTDCASGSVLKKGAESLNCKGIHCTSEECCVTPAGTPSPTTAVTATRKTKYCDTFKDCTGTDKKGRKYTTSVGKAGTCLGVCDKETCCGKEAEATCFPGEAEISTNDGSRVAVALLHMNMEVLADGQLEPVIGMLHSHAEVAAAAAYTAPTSA